MDNNTDSYREDAKRSPAHLHNSLFNIKVKVTENYISVWNLDHHPFSVNYPKDIFLERAYISSTNVLFYYNILKTFPSPTKKQLIATRKYNPLPI